MIRLLFLIPLVLCLLWMLFLTYRGYSFTEGKQGFIYILVISTVIAAFYTLMWFIT
ncbi:MULTISPECIES: hypothetical protein [Aliidiomarina]|uniref:hypothetical protein n=1 Tax=Aliidiomarina TaxID=1249554 RepID=UPI0018E53868|nr:MULTISPECIES: hypothetical protein [Aliidiomarina]